MQLIVAATCIAEDLFVFKTTPDCSARYSTVGANINLRWEVRTLKQAQHQ